MNVSLFISGKRKIWWVGIIDCLDLRLVLVYWLLLDYLLLNISLDLWSEFLCLTGEPVMCLLWWYSVFVLVSLEFNASVIASLCCPSRLFDEWKILNMRFITFGYFVNEPNHIQACGADNYMWVNFNDMIVATVSDNLSPVILIYIS